MPLSWPSRAAQLHRCTYVRTLAEPPPPRLVLRMAVKSMHRPCARSLPRCRPVGNHKTRLPGPRLCPGLLQKPPRGAGWPSQQMFSSPLCSLPPASCAGTIHKHGCQRPHSASWHRPMDKGRLEFSAEWPSNQCTHRTRCWHKRVGKQALQHTGPARG